VHGRLPRRRWRRAHRVRKPRRLIARRLPGSFRLLPISHPVGSKRSRPHTTPAWGGYCRDFLNRLVYDYSSAADFRPGSLTAVSRTQAPRTSKCFCTVQRCLSAHCSSSSYNRCSANSSCPGLEAPCGLDDLHALLPGSAPGGYGYAHMSASRLSIRRQAQVHIALLGLTLLLLRSRLRKPGNSSQAGIRFCRSSAFSSSRQAPRTWCWPRPRLFFTLVCGKPGVNVRPTVSTLCPTRARSWRCSATHPASSLHSA